MAPTGQRRPGTSRRAQYGTFYSYVLAAIGVGVGVLLLAAAGNSDSFSGLRTFAADRTVPAGQLSAKARSDGRSFFAVLGGYFTRGAHLARLEREVAEARVKLAEQAALAEENQRLKAMLALKEGDPQPVAIARLIGSSSSSTRRFATLGAGTAQGVKTGMPVRSPTGLVGRVLEVGQRSARVLLITDSESVVPVRRASDGIPAFATGRADGTLQIRLINLGVNPLKKGDAFVTSGSGGLYRPNTAIAVVSALTPDGAIAQPLSDPGASEFVAVEQAWEESAGLAPPPAPPSAQQGKR